MDGSRVRTVLTIAGSDSGGGAGIQADLKALVRCGVYPMTAITAVTAQNTLGVSAIHPVPGALILAQVRAVCSDLPIDAVKVGMLGSGDGARAVAQALRELPPQTPIVVDPVMVAESGAPLLDDDAQATLVKDVLPLATVATPNVPEARVLAGASARTQEGEDELAEAQQLALGVLALGPRAVVLTGGHRRRAVDLFVSADGQGAGIEIAGERHPDGAAHGSGCTHSSVLAAQLALGATPLAAARTARAMTGEAVRRGLRELGGGAGPVDVLDLQGMPASG